MSTPWLARCVHGLVPAEESRLSQALERALRAVHDRCRRDELQAIQALWRQYRDRKCGFLNSDPGGGQIAFPGEAV